MTRARAGGEDEERFGSIGRGLVRRCGDWCAWRPDDPDYEKFSTYREALDYALGGQHEH